MHLIVVPAVALFLGGCEGPVQELAPEGPVHVHEAEPPEGWQEELPLHRLDLRKAGHLPADGVVAHQGSAVIGAAGPVVKVLASPQVCPCPKC